MELTLTTWGVGGRGRGKGEEKKARTIQLGTQCQSKSLWVGERAPVEGKGWTGWGTVTLFSYAASLPPTPLLLLIFILIQTAHSPAILQLICTWHLRKCPSVTCGSQILQFTRTKLVFVKDLWSISPLHTHNYIPITPFSYRDLQVPLLDQPSLPPAPIKLLKALSMWLINTISVPEQRNYFINIFQFLNFFISSWSTESPHHPNNKFDQLSNIKGPIFCLLFYQIQIKNFCNLASQSSMTRQQERQEILKWKVFNSVLVLHTKDYCKDQNSYWTTFYLN